MPEVQREGALGDVMHCRLLILIVFCGGCAHTDTRENGYETGRKAVRVIRDANGPPGEMAIRAAELSPNPADPKKSPEWNGGFRAGVRDELDNDTRPQPRR
jgi:hypothetical protein